jgi:hypothetical protein
MGLQRWLKLPVRAAREVVRAVRRASPAPPAPASPVPAAPPPAPAMPPLRVVVEDTPNPEARKFQCGVAVVASGSVVANAGTTGHAPWIEALLARPGVRTVFATRDFVTITRDPSGPDWTTLSADVVDTLQRVLPR